MPPIPPITRRRKERSDRYAVGAGLPPDARPIPVAPPPALRGRSDPLAQSIEGNRSYISNVAGMLQTSSIAYLMDAQYQQMMLRDPSVCASLNAVMLPIATAEWEILPDDKDDPRQAALCEWLTDIYRRIPRRVDMVRNMCMCKWFGPSLVNFQIEADPRTRIRVKGWTPIHPDAVVFDWVGNVGMKVGSKYTTQLSITDIGINASVHMFDRSEREVLVLSRYMSEAPNFDNAQSSDQVFRGTGDRDRVWFWWWFQQEVMQQAGIWCRRYAGGFRIGRYPDGNTTAKDEMVEILANIINDNSVVLPRTQQQDKDEWDIEIKEAQASRATMFIDLLEFTASKIKELIEGQSLTSEAGANGLGGKTAGAHENTKSLTIKGLADIVAESITTDMLWSLARMIGAEEDTLRACRLHIVTERPDEKERAESAKVLYEMGVPLKGEELRAKCGGWTKPEDGDEVIQRQTDPLAGLLGADTRNENAAA